MEAKNKGPFVGGIHINKPVEVLPLSGTNFSEDAIRDSGLSQEELDILKQEEELEIKRVQIQQKKNAAKAEAEQALLTQRDKAKEAAANFRREARTCPDEAEKKNLYEWATEADREARRIEVELGLAVDTLPDAGEEHKTFFRRNRWATALLQVLGVILAIYYFHARFNGYREEMEQLNKGLAVENQLQPYDETSIQKLFYEKLVVFSDLPLALLILLLIAPFVGFYVLPFLKSRKDFYTEFYEDLTAWQRTIIATAFCLGLLFFLALSHMVKP